MKNFLRDLLKEAKKINDVSEDKLIEYTDTMVNNSLQSNKFIQKISLRLRISKIANHTHVSRNRKCPFSLFPRYNYIALFMFVIKILHIFSCKCSMPIKMVVYSSRKWQSMSLLENNPGHHSISSSNNCFLFIN